MASEQTRSKKKQTKDISKGENRSPVLYRHKDCIPDATKLQSSVSSKSNKIQDIKTAQGCCIKSTKEQETNNQQNNIRIKKTNVITNLDLKSKEAKLSTQQANITECNNEELSKSRKRRLRKQRLLESLAPILNTCNKPSPSLGSSLKTKLITQSSTQSNIVPLLPVSSTNKPSEPTKLSSKDSRKRLDKSAGLRVKNSIKSKTLIESPLNQSKANLIKSLEGKALNSLLQTLAPLGNSPPIKDKTSSPKFTFHDKKINDYNSKVGKDGVFYFGETKHQLEKVASGFNNNSSSYIFKNTPDSGQSNKPGNSGNLETREDCFSPLKFSPKVLSSDKFSIDTLKRNEQAISFLSTVGSSKFISSRPSSKVLSSDTFSIDSLDRNEEAVSLLSKVGNSTFIPNCPSSELFLSKPSEKNLSSFPKLDFRSPAVFPQCFSNSPLIDTGNILNKVITPSESIHNSNSSPPLITGFNKAEKVSVAESDKKVPANTMNSSEGINKPSKTREEVLLEREAKKAAKMAAKNKQKNPQSNKVVSETSNIILAAPKQELVTESNKIDTQTSHQEIKVPLDAPTNINVHLENASTEKLPMVPSSKDKQEPAGKSKAELRAERRAKQETQRAAKTTNKTLQNQLNDKITTEKKTSNVAQLVPLEKKSNALTTIKTSTQAKPKLFSHLYRENPSLTSNKLLSTRSLHPAVVRLGVQYSKRVVAGSNARCVALLHALKQVVKDYTTPLEKEFSRGLEEELGSITVFLDQCRPLAVSMTNALRHIKRTLTQLPNNIPDIEARRKICDVVDTYIHEQIDVAGEAICNRVIEKIADGDVILTYGCSSLVYQILVKSHVKGTKFRVVVVDGLPWREGREMLRRLVDKGLSCTYVLITAASFTMREASKVLLGAHALLANGYVMARAGSSQVALLAHCNNVPVLVCCETHKFCERVQTDAFVYNELGEICCENMKDKEKGKVMERLTPLSLAYDITPPDLVSAVVTELAVLPCTSVPVILRIKPSESVM